MSSTGHIDVTVKVGLGTVQNGRPGC
jgi:hypothetical protein